MDNRKVGYAVLEENFERTADICDVQTAVGIARVKRETYAFLAELGYVYDEQAGAYRTEGGNHERVALAGRAHRCGRGE